jgi:hypothetical protein
MQYDLHWANKLVINADSELTCLMGYKGHG